MAYFEFGRGWGRGWERKGLLAGLTCDINMDSHIQGPSLSQYSPGSCWQSIVNKSLGNLIRAGGRGQGPRLSSALPPGSDVDRSSACDFLLYFENPQALSGQKIKSTHELCTTTELCWSCLLLAILGTSFWE